MSIVDALCEEFDTVLGSGGQIIYPLPVFLQRNACPGMRNALPLTLDGDLNSRLLAITRVYVPRIPIGGLLTLSPIKEKEFWDTMLCPEDVAYYHYIELSCDEDSDAGERSTILCIIFLKSKDIEELQDRNFEYRWMDVYNADKSDNPYRDIVDRRGDIGNNHLGEFRFEVGPYSFSLGDLYDMIADKWHEIEQYV